MDVIVRLYSSQRNEINKFLNDFYGTNEADKSHINLLEWEKSTKILLRLQKL